MKHRGRPRRSSMPAVAHHKLSDDSLGSLIDHSSVAFTEENDPQYSLSEFSRIRLVDQHEPVRSPENFSCSNYPSQNSEYYLDRQYDPSQNTDNSNVLEIPDSIDFGDSADVHSSNRKRALSFSSSTNFDVEENANQTNTLNGDKRAATKICRVCGDKAYSYNFNVITCESCKAFFRRNANKHKEMRCPFNEECNITIISRRFCQRCRLQKCFQVGMKKEWIMTEQAKLEKKQRIHENRERRIAEQKMRQQQELKLQAEQNDLVATVSTATLTVSDSSPSNDFLIGVPSIETTISAIPPQAGCNNNMDMPPDLLTTCTAPVTALSNNISGVTLNFTSVTTASSSIHTFDQIQQQSSSSEISNTSNSMGLSVGPEATAAFAAAAAAAAQIQPVPGNSASLLLQQTPTAAAAAAAVQCAVVAAMQQHQSEHHQQQIATAAAAAAALPPAVVAAALASEQVAAIGGPLANSLSTTTSSSLLIPSQPCASGVVEAATHLFNQNAAQLDLQQQLQQQQTINAAEPPVIPDSGPDSTPTIAHSQCENNSSPLLGDDCSDSLTLNQKNSEFSSLLPTAVTTTTLISEILQPVGRPQSPPKILITNSNQVPQCITQFGSGGIVVEQSNPILSVIDPVQQQSVLSNGQTNDIPEIAILDPSSCTLRQPVSTSMAIQLQQQAVVEQIAAAQQQQEIAAAVVAQIAAVSSVAAAAAASLTSPQESTHNIATVLNVTGQPTQICHSQQQQQQQSQQGQSSSSDMAIQQLANTLASTTSSVVIPAQQQAPPVVNAQSLALSVPSATSSSSLSQLIDAAAAVAAAATSTNNPSAAATTAQTVALLAAASQQQAVQQQQQPAASALASTTTNPLMTMPALLSTAVQISNATAAVQNQEMVTVPRDMFVKLLEEKIENDQQQQQAYQFSQKCQCICRCGRYPEDIPIVDRVMLDLLEGSSRQLGGGGSGPVGSSPNNIGGLVGSNAAAEFVSAFSAAADSLNMSTVSTTNGTSAMYSQSTDNSTMNTTSTCPSQLAQPAANPAFAHPIRNVCGGLTLADQEAVAEVSKANTIWNKFILAAEDDQFPEIGVTEAGLRRLFHTVNSLGSFRALERNDMIQILRYGCQGFIILRGLLQYDETKHPILQQRGFSDRILSFYRDFPLEWRKDERVNLLLGIILLFNSETPELKNTICIAIENMKYQSLLRRLLQTICASQEDPSRGALAAAELMLCVEKLKRFNLLHTTSNICTTNQNVQNDTCNLTSSASVSHMTE